MFSPLSCHPRCLLRVSFTPPEWSSLKTLLGRSAKDSDCTLKTWCGRSAKESDCIVTGGGFHSPVSCALNEARQPGAHVPTCCEVLACMYSSVTAWIGRHAAMSTTDRQTDRHRHRHRHRLESKRPRINGYVRSSKLTKGSHVTSEV